MSLAGVFLVLGHGPEIDSFQCQHRQPFPESVFTRYENGKRQAPSCASVPGAIPVVR